MCCSSKSVEVIDSSSRYPLQQGYYNRSLNNILSQGKEKKERVVISITSKGKGTLQSKAEKALEKGDYAEAIKLYKEMILYFPVDEEGFFGLGKLYIELK